ncbi:hypothetical protein PISMIDRAFT_612255 [Pisolithus microcarpus 441]|uniref:Uncharacterized protein n=1 Tax=Pisolithus microcarpus 441 TaxID=765257 RepID=A0A0C9ZQB2_9AGAM|nr:hypothetical protein PISMIDRAFT_612255 [Pisolithus microcarpus 441]
MDRTHAFDGWIHALMDWSTLGLERRCSAHASSFLKEWTKLPQLSGLYILATPGCSSTSHLPKQHDHPGRVRCYPHRGSGLRHVIWHNNFTGELTCITCTTLKMTQSRSSSLLSYGFWIPYMSRSCVICCIIT